MNRLVVDADLGATRVSRHIYGHFAEHLGRCIYEGGACTSPSPTCTPSVPLPCHLRGLDVSAVNANVLTAGRITAHNTFDDPAAVEPAPFDGWRRTALGLELELPPRSVVALHLT